MEKRLFPNSASLHPGYFLKCLVTTIVLIAVSFPSGYGEQTDPLSGENPIPVVPLTDREKSTLIAYARKAINNYLEKGSSLQVPAEEQTPALKEQKGCFVTLTKGGVLRGCIGCLVPKERLCDCVVSNALAMIRIGGTWGFPNRLATPISAR